MDNQYAEFIAVEAEARAEFRQECPSGWKPETTKGKLALTALREARKALKEITGAPNVRAAYVEAQYTPSYKGRSASK